MVGCPIYVNRYGIYQQSSSISYTLYDFLEILVIIAKEQIIFTVNNTKKLEEKRGSGEIGWEGRQVGGKVAYYIVAMSSY